MENSKSGTNKIVIGILALLLLGVIGYSVTTNNKLKASNAFLEEEKVKIGEDLDAMVAKYDEAIKENSSISEELKIERDQIVLFRDSVKSLKQTNWSILKRYRGKIAVLESSKQVLFRQNDSLRISNQFLAQEIDSARVHISNQIAQIDTLNIHNNELNEKIGIGAKLQVNSVNAISMRQRNNGQFKETSRARRTDALRVSFRIAENFLAEESTKNALIQIVNTEGKVVKNLESELLNNENEITFTDKIEVEYIKDNLDVVSLIEVNRKEMMKGAHTVNVFLEDRLVGTSKFTLK